MRFRAPATIPSYMALLDTAPLELDETGFVARLR
jgi:hypothetical protein